MPFLDWVNKNQAVRTTKDVPYHLLKREKDVGQSSGNLLIQGDNLLALKALRPFFAGSVKCIYIDPPYNTQNAFEYYDDKLEHSQWLTLIYTRLSLLRDLLAEDGFIVVQIDDSESHYLKILLDEVFGRQNYQTTLYMQVRYAAKTLKQDMAYHKQIEQALVYRKSSAARPYKPVVEIEGFDKYTYDIKEIYPGKEIELGGKRVLVFQPGEYQIVEVPGHVDGLKEIWASGTILDGNSSGRFFRDYLDGRTAEDGLGALYKVQDIGDDGLGYRYFTGPKKATATKGKYYQGVPFDKRELDNQNKETPIENFYDFSGQFGNCRQEGGVDFRGGKKPEKLIQTILNYFTKPGDLVLDSFLGSATTAAVAHKMGRRYIGIEIGDHAQSHGIQRLTNVINGDQTGISKEIGWAGGGGFSFCTLSDPVFNQSGHINPDIDFSSLASFVWHLETGLPGNLNFDSPLLGVHNGTAYYLLYNGILGDKRPLGGNVLNTQVLKAIHEILPFDGPKVIYGEAVKLGANKLDAESITFKQIPYDINLV